MTLTELRKKWENGCEPITSFKSGNTIYMILGAAKNKERPNSQKKYQVHRYFPVGDVEEWGVSVDLSETSFQDLMIWVMSNLMPREI